MFGLLGLQMAIFLIRLVFDGGETVALFFIAFFAFVNWLIIPVTVETSLMATIGSK